MSFSQQQSQQQTDAKSTTGKLTSARARSPLTKDLEWPTDIELITKLHGGDFHFYLTAVVRQHIIKNHLKNLEFTDRDPKQAYPFLIELTKVFNPISMLSLYKEMLEHYISLVAAEKMPFNEAWYLNSIRSFHSLDSWEDGQGGDWFWRFALRQVVFMPNEGCQKLLKMLPGWDEQTKTNTDWVWIKGPNEEHTGVPEEYLIERFGNLCHRVGSNYQVISYDLVHNSRIKIPSINSTGRWGIVYHKNSPFKYVVSHAEHFYLSLYPNLGKDYAPVAFSFAMALDILQYNFTRADWVGNVFATKHYWKLCHADNKGLLRLNTPISQPTTSIAAGSTVARATSIDGNSTSIGQPAISPGNRQTHNNEVLNPEQVGTTEPQPFSDMRLAIKIKAADVCFDYCSDWDLSLLVTDLEALVHNTNLPKKQRAIDYIVLDHLKAKIEMFNQVQLAATNPTAPQGY